MSIYDVIIIVKQVHVWCKDVYSLRQFEVRLVDPGDEALDVGVQGLRRRRFVLANRLLCALLRLFNALRWDPATYEHPLRSRYSWMMLKKHAGISEDISRCSVDSMLISRNNYYSKVVFFGIFLPLVKLWYFIKLSKLDIFIAVACFVIIVGLKSEQKLTYNNMHVIMLLFFIHVITIQ